MAKNRWNWLSSTVFCAALICLLDPWFSGGSINYYYYGYIIVAALIKLTGIAPTTAFNLAIPTLFALTFTGSFSLVYSLSRRVSVALLGGYLVALLGNLDGAVQVLQQLALWLRHLPVPAFSYWQSKACDSFTINEFPFWSFLFSDLHAHVIAMPFSVLLLGMIASCLLARPAKSAIGGESAYPSCISAKISSSVAYRQIMKSGLRVRFSIY